MTELEIRIKNLIEYLDKEGLIIECADEKEIDLTWPTYAYIAIRGDINPFDGSVVAELKKHHIEMSLKSRVDEGSDQMTLMLELLKFKGKSVESFIRKYNTLNQDYPDVLSVVIYKKFGEKLTADYLEEKIVEMKRNK